MIVLSQILKTTIPTSRDGVGTVELIGCKVPLVLHTFEHHFGLQILSTAHESCKRQPPCIHAPSVRLIQSRPLFFWLGQPSLPAVGPTPSPEAQHLAPVETPPRPQGCAQE